MNDGPAKDSNGAANNAPGKGDDPAGSRGAMLAAHARTLDSRLRVAAQSDRQATRRAAAHVVQLARRIARLLPRVPTLLPVLPDGGREPRIRHYVLKTQPVVGTSGTRILTISTHSVLRYGEFDGSGKPVLWNEYDPLQPVIGWDLETVLERLAEVLGQITAHVESLEARVAERAKTLNSLLNSSPVSNRPLAPSLPPKAPSPIALPAFAPTVPGPAPANSAIQSATPTAAPSTATTSTPATSSATPSAPLASAPKSAATPAPIAPPGRAISYGQTPTAEPARRPVPSDDLLSVAASQESEASPPTGPGDQPEASDDALPELALIDLAFGAPPAEYEIPAETAPADEDAEPVELFPIGTATDSTSPTAAPAAPAPSASTAAEATAEREKRERRLFQHLRAR